MNASTDLIVQAVLQAMIVDLNGKMQSYGASKLVAFSDKMPVCTCMVN